ncbi:Rgp1-domain-containing protein [Panus rudis PR-1116 ss-1]|nr:Rgp1-domain-containing protein [Panus rudis PR-1116 ss-1]
MSETTVDEAIRVVVTPSQASYFAGEPFSVTITITNTRTPESLPARSASHSASNSHKRGAHSISSVPLARPPTSPGIRTSVAAYPVKHAHSTEGHIVRRHLIGAGGQSSKDVLQDPSVSRRRPNLPKSLSISLVPTELPSSLSEDLKGKSPVRTLQNGEQAHPSPTSPRISSPLTRSASVPINHPHARKQSVLDGQLQLHDLRPPPTLSPFSPTPNASMSAFSLSLDPIAESAASPQLPATPAVPSPIPETDPKDFRSQIPSVPTPSSHTRPAGPYSYPPRATNNAPRRPTHLGLGHGPPPSSAAPSRTAFSSTFRAPNTELILYSYAQLAGTMSITPLPGSMPSPDHMRTLQTVRNSLLKRQAIGGGSMDISLGLQSPSSNPLSPGLRRKVSHGRSSSLSAGIMSLLSPSASAPSTSVSWTPSHRARTPSMFSGLFSSASSHAPASGESGLGLGLSVEEDAVDPEAPMPTFEVQPAMLAVDLPLAPGESRSYTYAITLPENLPPTFRGRALKFSYQFIVGICRAASSASPGSAGIAGANSRSRVMKVPIRVYNHVMLGKPPSPYDLLWPVNSQRAPISAKVTEEPSPSHKGTVNAVAPKDLVPAEGSFSDLQGYACELLSSLSSEDPNTRNLNPPARAPIGTLAWSHVDYRDRPHVGMEDRVSGCREAVEILTRNPRKLSYDVNKDGVKVAVLTFTKSAYRLGEPVLGVVELNERTSRARVLKLSALLEAHESLPGCIAPPSNSRHLRRVHAEQHSSFMTSTLRTTFSLDIPPDGSPAFQVDVKKHSLGAAGGLEWKVRLCLLVSVASMACRSDGESVRLKTLVRDGPRGEWGSAWKAASTVAPKEQPDPRALHEEQQRQATSPTTAVSWMSYLASSILGASEIGYHDGDEEDEEESGGSETVGEEDEWRELKVEMVECEVPIKVWPGHTAFKANEVVFEL